MTLLDKNHELDSALDMTGLSVGNNYTSNSIDLTTARDIATGHELFLVFSITTSIVTANNVIFGYAIGTGVNGSGVLNAGIEIPARTNAFATASLDAGAQFAIPLRSLIVSDTSGTIQAGTPVKNTAGNIGARYLAGFISCITSVPTAGVMDVYLSTNVEDNRKYYPKAWYMN